MKQAFTLVELLVVIAIIGVLAGVLMGTFSGGSESARAAQCLSNMRNLAQACQSYGASDTIWHHYPAAGSHEYMQVDTGGSRPKVVYYEVKGWVSWYSQSAYKNQPSSHQASGAWMTSTYSTDEKERLFSLTNGALWRFVGGSTKTYVCPNHMKTMNLKKEPIWSYLMNSRFGWDYSKGSKCTGVNVLTFGSLDNADKVLLFSEIPYSGIGNWQPQGEGASTDCDCVLQYNGSLVGDGSSKGSGHECIGVNHKNGKNLFAHVAFADGHTEKLRIPYGGSIKKPEIDDNNLRNLTAWLCVGKDVSLEGDQYKKMD